MAKNDPSVKSFHIFLSYRVVTDASLSEKLCDKLQQLEIERENNLRIKCFLDKQDLKFGENWEEGFLQGLYGSCLFVPLFSEASLQYLVDSRPGVKDNCMLEFETALRLYNEEKIDILPIFVGSNAGGVYKKFNGFGFKFPEHATATNPSGSIKATLMPFFKLQGIFLNPEEIKDKLQVLQHRLSLETWPRFRASWANVAELGPERMFTCVQCKDEYYESGNGEGHCSFHAKWHSDRSYACCNQRYEPPRLYALPTPQPFKPGQPARPPVMQEVPGARDAIAKYRVPGCTRMRHRPAHHYDYLYESWFEWSGSILNYSDTRDVWTSIEAENLETGTSLYFEMGTLLKGNSKGHLYISMSGNQDRRYFAVFDPKAINDIESLAIARALRSAEKDVAEHGHFNPHKLVELEGQSLENSNGKSSYVWDIVADKLSGITATLTSPTCPTPSVVKVLFDIEPDIVKKDVQIVSVAKVTEKAPSKPYAIPSVPWVKGAFIPELEVRKPQTDFKSFGDLNGRLKFGKIVVNEWRKPSNDIFSLEVSFINNDSATPMTLVELTAEYAHAPVNNNAPASEVEWHAFDYVDVTAAAAAGAGGAADKAGNKLPLKVEASGAVTLSIRLNAEFTDAPGASATYNHATIARKGPIIIRLKAEAGDGKTTTLPIEWINPTALFRPSTEANVHQMYVDNSAAYNYESVSVTIVSEPTVSVKIYGFNTSYTYEDKELREFAFQVTKKDDGEPLFAEETGAITPATKILQGLNLPYVTKQTYVRLKAFITERNDFSTEMGILVDPTCNRSAAVLAVLASPTVSVVYHYAIPLYGETSTVVDTAYYATSPAVPAGFAEKTKEAVPVKVRPIGALAWVDPSSSPAATSSISTSSLSSSAGGAAAPSGSLSPEALGQIEQLFTSLLERRMTALDNHLQSLEASLLAKIDGLEAKIDAISAASASSEPSGSSAPSVAATIAAINKSNDPAAAKKTFPVFRR